MYRKRHKKLASWLVHRGDMRRVAVAFKQYYFPNRYSKLRGTANLFFFLHWRKDKGNGIRDNWRRVQPWACKDNYISSFVCFLTLSTLPSSLWQLWVEVEVIIKRYGEIQFAVLCQFFPKNYGIREGKKIGWARRVWMVVEGRMVKT
jgi:hypothetical protein